MQQIDSLIQQVLEDDTLNVINRRKSKGERSMRLKVVLEPSNEGSSAIYVPSLSVCISEGEAEQEALAEWLHSHQTLFNT